MTIDPATSTDFAPVPDREFKEKLAAILPHLRAFGRSLCGCADTADDLVQETMLKAWKAREMFRAGTNFKAWTFTILRNYYLTQMRRRKFVGAWDDLVADRLLAAPAGQEKSTELRDMVRALQQLPVAQREALILVGAGGVSYEETAEILGVAIGTVKSRVGRGRAALEALVNGGQLEQTRGQFAGEGEAIVSILTYLETLKRPRVAIADRGCAPVLALAA